MANPQGGGGGGGGGEDMPERMVEMIIRPPRAHYSMDQLGPPSFQLGNLTVSRTDFHIKNKKDQKLQCSLFEPSPRPTEKLPCVIFLHGNASCRVEALNISTVVLSSRSMLLGVDLSGSGKSDGDYISLGINEKEDVKSIIEHLKKEGRTSKIVLWGRSMGAATALKYCGETEGAPDDLVKGIIVDSPFSSLNELAHDIVAKFQLPVLARQALVLYGMKKADVVLKQKMGFTIDDIQPGRAARNCTVPVLMMHGTGDDFILPKHSQQCYEAYAGTDKRLLMVEGDHDSPRPQWALDHAYVFLQHKLIAGGSIPSSSSLSSPLSSLSSSVEGKEEKEEEVEVVVGGGGEEGAARVIPALSLPDMWKQRGNALAKQNRWDSACEWYSRAIDFWVEEVKAGREEARIDDSEPQEAGMMEKWFRFLCGGVPETPQQEQKTTDVDRFLAVLYSNCSLGYLQTGKKEQSLEAAIHCVRHNPDFVKGFYRKALAHLALDQPEAARITAEEGLVLEPSNTDLIEIKEKAVEKANEKREKERERGGEVGGMREGEGEGGNKIVILDEGMMKQLADEEGEEEGEEGKGDGE